MHYKDKLGGWYEGTALCRDKLDERIEWSLHALCGHCQLSRAEPVACGHLPWSCDRPSRWSVSHTPFQGAVPSKSASGGTSIAPSKCDSHPQGPDSPLVGTLVPGSAGKRVHSIRAQLARPARAHLLARGQGRARALRHAALRHVFTRFIVSSRVHVRVVLSVSKGFEERRRTWKGM